MRMRCLRDVLKQRLTPGYVTRIPRLMVIGLHALLPGVALPKSEQVKMVVA